MVDAARSKNRTILIVDDNEDVHQDFRKILIAEPESDELDDLEASIFGASNVRKPMQSFELSSAYQGAEALDKVRSAHLAGRPYALAFVDVRMPPGWDGVETLTRLWEEDSSLQAVICSAYSDYAWDHISRRFGTTDNLLVLRKPFDPAEVLQMAATMTEKWNQHADWLLAHLRLNVQKSILAALVKASSLDQGASEMLHIIGAELGSQLGALWTLHPASGELLCECAWSSPAAELEALAAELRATRFSPGLGPLAGLGGDETWISALGAAGCDARDARAASAGMHSALRLPLRCSDGTVGLLELFAPGADVSQGTLAALTPISDSIAQFVKNHQTEP
jgi:CheY-like chemotaxis protein